MVETKRQPPGGAGVAHRSNVVEHSKTDGRFRGTDNLTPKQEAFITAYVANGGKQQEAAREAGYATPRVDGWKLLTNPAIQKAVQERINQAVTQGQVVAWGVMQELMMDPTVQPATRFAASKWTLEASGHGLEAAKLKAKIGLEGHKSMSDMTTDELELHVANLAAAIQAKKDCEGAIEAESEDITPQ